VSFQPDGKIGKILLLKGLADGLSQQAIAAARKIKFKPAMENGVPVPSLRVIEYTFSIY